MRFGLNFFPSFRLEDMSTAEYYSLGIKLSERADELGYTSVKAVEHYFHDYGGHSPKTILFFLAVAPRPRRLPLVTGPVLSPFTQPIKPPPPLSLLAHTHHNP